MSTSLEEDLVAAHGDSLVAGELSYRERYGPLFSAELAMLEPLFEMGEQLYFLLHGIVMIRPEFRAELKADLIAQAHQQAHAERPTIQVWQWAAIGVGATVAVGLAAAAWRQNNARR